MRLLKRFFKLNRYLKGYVYLFLIFFISILLFFVFRFSKPQPNDDIYFLGDNSGYMLENKNPNFNVSFGIKEEPKKQWIRFEARPSKENPFKEESKNILEEIGDIFKRKETLGIEMSLIGVEMEQEEDLSFSLEDEEIKKVADILKENTIQVSTELVEIDSEETEENYAKKIVLNENVVDGVNLEYQILKGVGLKEEIVIEDLEGYREKCDEDFTNCKLPLNKYVFELKLDQGLNLKKGWYSFNNTNRETYYFVNEKGDYVAHFLPNYAVDREGNKTYDVILDIVKEGDSYRAEITVDIGWLLSPERVFPVRIDPSIVHDTEDKFGKGVFNKTENISGLGVCMKQGNLFGSYTSPVLDLENPTNSVILSWEESGVKTGHGEVPYSNLGIVADWSFNQGEGKILNAGGTCGVLCNGTLINFSNINGNDISIDTGWTSLYSQWGGALMFDGVDDWISIGQIEQLKEQRISFEGWVWFEDFEEERPVFSSLDTNGGNGYLLKGDSLGNIHFQILNSEGEIISDLNGNNTVSAKRWHYIAVTMDGYNTKLYTDGVLVDEEAYLDVIPYGEFSHFQIGRESTKNQKFFKGAIDTIRIYSRPLYLGEIVSNYQSSQIQMQYRLSEDGKNWEEWQNFGNVKDLEVDLSKENEEILKSISVENIQNISMISFDIASNQTGKVGDIAIGQTLFTNYEMDDYTVGVWNYLDTTGNSENAYESIIKEDISVSEGITIESWIQIDSKEILESPTSIIKNGLENSGYELSISNREKCNVTLSLYGTSNEQICFEYLLPEKELIYLAITYDGSNVRLYENGKIKEVILNSGTLTPVINDEYKIGGNQSNIIIDRIRLSNISRSQEEIYQVYNSNSYPIEVFFSANLKENQLINSFETLSFEIKMDEEEQNITDLYEEDRMLLREELDGKIYLAEAVVEDFDTETGLVKISNWQENSIFPSTGFSQNAEIFKWEKKYFILPEYLKGGNILNIINVLFSFEDMVDGKSIRLNNFQTWDNFSTTVSEKSLSFEQEYKYIQYRGVFVSSDSNVSSCINSVQVEYAGKETPSMEKIMRHGKWFGEEREQSFWWIE